MKSTEASSKYDDLEKMSVTELLHHINEEDKNVPHAVEKALPQIETLVQSVVEKVKAGGRLFYIGAGTSGRLGIVDASECPPTFGVSNDQVIAIIAGGEVAIRNAVEHAEDDIEQAWSDLKKYNIKETDFVIGITASGYTPYVLGGIKCAKDNGIATGCITCNTETPLASIADFPVEVIVGPEFVTGSTRMKAGTAQKLVLNMISTTLMVQIGRVKGNKMVDMQLSNNKLVDRGIKMLAEELKIEYGHAEKLLNKHGNVRKAIEWYRNNA